MKTFFKIVLAVVLVAVLGVAGVFYFTADMAGVADGFFAAARNGDMAKAYGYLSDDFRQGTSEEQLAGYLKRQGLDRSTRASWTNRSISGARGTLSGALSTESGGSIPLTLEFVQGEQGWKIFAIKKPAAGIQQESGAATLPAEAELVRMVDETMQVFARSVNAQGMGALYDHISGLWRRQTSVEQLDEIFKPFFGVGIDLTILTRYSPIFSRSPSLNADGVLELEGRYPTKPNQVHFDQKYVYEGMGWKLIGLSVNVK